jgi:hypothetical protein
MEDHSSFSRRDILWGKFQATSVSSYNKMSWHHIHRPLSCLQFMLWQHVVEHHTIHVNLHYDFANQAMGALYLGHSATSTCRYIKGEVRLTKLNLMLNALIDRATSDGARKIPKNKLFYLCDLVILHGSPCSQNCDPDNTRLS